MRQTLGVIFFSFSIIHGWPDSAQNRLYVIMEKLLLQKWEICTDSTSSFWNGPCFPLHTARNQSRHTDAAFMSFAASDLNLFLETFHLQLSLHSVALDVMSQHLLRWWDLPLRLSFRSWWTARGLFDECLIKGLLIDVETESREHNQRSTVYCFWPSSTESPEQPCTRKSRKLWLGLSKGFSMEKTTHPTSLWPSQSGWQATQGTQLPNPFFIVPPT